MSMYDEDATRRRQSKISVYIGLTCFCVVVILAYASRTNKAPTQLYANHTQPIGYTHRPTTTSSLVNIDMQTAIPLWQKTEFQSQLAKSTRGICRADGLRNDFCYQYGTLDTNRLLFYILPSCMSHNATQFIGACRTTDSFVVDYCITTDDIDSDLCLSEQYICPTISMNIIEQQHVYEHATEAAVHSFQINTTVNSDFFAVHVNMGVFIPPGLGTHSQLFVQVVSINENMTMRSVAVRIQAIYAGETRFLLEFSTKNTSNGSSVLFVISSVQIYFGGIQTGSIISLYSAETSTCLPATLSFHPEQIVATCNRTLALNTTLLPVGVLGDTPAYTYLTEYISPEFVVTYPSPMSVTIAVSGCKEPAWFDLSQSNAYHTETEYVLRNDSYLSDKGTPKTPYYLYAQGGRHSIRFDQVFDVRSTPIHFIVDLCNSESGYISCGFPEFYTEMQGCVLQVTAVAYSDKECVSHTGWPSLTVTPESDPIVIPIRQSFQYDTRSDAYQQFSNTEGYITFARTATIDFSQTGLLDICTLVGHTGCMCHPVFSMADSRNSLILKLVDPYGIAWDLRSPFVVNSSTQFGLVLMAHIFDGLTYASAEGLRTFSLLALVCVYVDVPDSAVTIEKIYNKTVVGPSTGRTTSFHGEWRQAVSYPLPSAFQHRPYCMHDVLTTTCRDGHFNDTCIVPYSCELQSEITARIMVKVSLPWPYIFNGDYSDPFYGPYVEFAPLHITVQTRQSLDFNGGGFYGAYYPKELVCPSEPLKHGNTPTSVTFVFDVGEIPTVVYASKAGRFVEHIGGIQLSSITTRWINIERYPYCSSDLGEMCAITQQVPLGSYRPLYLKCTIP